MRRDAVAFGSLNRIEKRPSLVGSPKKRFTSVGACRSLLSFGIFCANQDRSAEPQAHTHARALPEMSARGMDNAQRDRLLSNVVGHLKKGVTEPVRARAIEYWRNVDQAVGDRIAKGVQGERMAAE